MFDWRKKAQKVSADLEALTRRVTEQARQKAIAEAEKKLWAKLSKFRCCVCGKKCQKPLTYYIAPYSDYGVQTGGGYHETIWDKPGDMKQCKKCGNWACTEPEEHIHADICKKCAIG